MILYVPLFSIVFNFLMYTLDFLISVLLGPAVFLLAAIFPPRLVPESVVLNLNFILKEQFTQKKQKNAENSLTLWPNKM